MFGFKSGKATPAPAKELERLISAEARLTTMLRDVAVRAASVIEKAKADAADIEAKAAQEAEAEVDRLEAVSPRAGCRIASPGGRSRQEGLDDGAGGAQRLGRPPRARAARLPRGATMILAMAKLRIMGPRQLLPDVLNVVQDTGLLHVAPVTPDAHLAPVGSTPKQLRLRRYLRRGLDDIEVLQTKLGKPQRPTAASQSRQQRADRSLVPTGPENPAGGRTAGCEDRGWGRRAGAHRQVSWLVRHLPGSCHPRPRAGNCAAPITCCSRQGRRRSSDGCANISPR